jgi:hypothetical protein
MDKAENPPLVELISMVDLSSDTLEVLPLLDTGSKWQAETIETRRQLMQVFRLNFDAIMKSDHESVDVTEFFHDVKKHRVTITSDGKSTNFCFIEKTRKFRVQRRDAQLFPDELAREKFASELVENNLTAGFCLVYKTVVTRAAGKELLFTRYTEYGGPQTILQHFSSNRYFRRSFAFELHAKIQVASAFATALKHAPFPFYQGDLHCGNVVVQSFDEPTDIEIRQRRNYRSRFLFRVIDFQTAIVPLKGLKPANAEEQILKELFETKRMALSDVLYFFTHYDKSCSVSEPKPPSLLTALAMQYVRVNFEESDVKILEGLVFMMLSFYEDPITQDTLFGGVNRIKRTRTKSTRRRSREHVRSSRRSRRTSLCSRRKFKRAHRRSRRTSLCSGRKFKRA